MVAKLVHSSFMCVYGSCDKRVFFLRYVWIVSSSGTKTQSRSLYLCSTLETISFVQVMSLWNRGLETQWLSDEVSPHIRVKFKHSIIYWKVVMYSPMCSAWRAKSHTCLSFHWLTKTSISVYFYTHWTSILLVYYSILVQQGAAERVTDRGHLFGNHWRKVEKILLWPSSVAWSLAQ